MTTWTTRWQAEDFPLRVESIEVPGHRIHRVMTGTEIGAGAVAVPVRQGRILLVRQYRIVCDATFWELPRGMADDADPDLVATALRELREETGVRASEGRLIGRIATDSGLLGARVGVVEVTVPDGEPSGGTDGEVEEARWFTHEELVAAIGDGSIGDGLTLAALMQWQACPNMHSE